MKTKFGFAGRQQGQEGENGKTQGTRSLSRKSQEGGTFVEVVVAVAILAIMRGGIISSINCGLFTPKRPIVL